MSIFFYEYNIHNKGMKNIKKSKLHTVRGLNDKRSARHIYPD